MKLLRLLAVLVPVLAVCLVVAASLEDVVGPGRFDPFLIVTVWYGTFGRKPDGMIAGGLAGLVQDMAGSVVPGTRYLSKLVVGYLVTLVAGRLIPGQLGTHVALLVGGTVVERVVLLAMGVMLGRDLGAGSLGTLLVAAIANAALGSLAFALASKLASRRERAPLRGPYGR